MRLSENVRGGEIKIDLLRIRERERDGDSLDKERV